MSDVIVPPLRNSLAYLPRSKDGEPNTHRFTYESILLNAGACAHNGIANAEVSQRITCLLYALDQLCGDYAPARKALQQDAVTYWLRLPDLKYLSGGGPEPADSAKTTS